jgi:uncharacterized protein YccT (UPF0319 family)
MKVKVRIKSGDEVHFDSNENPVMIVFEGREKDIVQEMPDANDRFVVHDGKKMTQAQVQAWLKERP